METAYRNFAVLMASMILMFSTAPFVILTGSLVGKRLSEESSLSTLPIAAMILGTVAGTLPAGFLFRKLGYKLSFMAAGLWSAAGAALAFSAMGMGSFPLFCAGTFMMGNNLAFAQQSRFVCLIGISEKRKNLMVSVFLTGGIVAGLLGPQLAKVTKDWMDSSEFSGSYAAHCAMMLAGVLVLTLYRSPPVPTQNKEVSAAGLQTQLVSPNFYYPMLCAMVSYAAMSFVMTATPVSMRTMRGFSFEDTAWVIQLHLLAMFVPSLFTGLIIDRFGNLSVIFAGLGFFFVSLITAMLGESIAHYVTALIFLGLGWNFMFISSTSLLVKLNDPGRLLSLQSKNDFFVFMGQSAAALLSGTVLNQLGWLNLNAATLVPIAAIFFLSLALARRLSGMNRGVGAAR